MARITVPGFSGVVRITAPQRLEDHQAQVAVDCDFRSGDLRPYYGDADTTYPDGPSGEATLFLYDEGKLIEEPGDLSFARSPVFFSDNVANDSRVFYTDNSDTATGEDLYPHVLESLADSGAMPAGNKRLGVPQPAELVFSDAFGGTLIDTEEQSGSVTKIYYHTKSVGDTDVKHVYYFFAEEGNPLEDGDKVIVSAPGVTAIPYTVNGFAGDPTEFGLKKSGAVWLKPSAPLKLADDKVVTFTLNNHGLASGDQVVINYANQAWRENTSIIVRHGMDRLKLYTVADETINTFKLKHSVDGVPTYFAHTATEAVTDNKLWVARIAPYENAIPDDATLDIAFATDASNKLKENILITYVIPENVTATWSYAATIDTVMDRSYCVTFVNEFGDESEPSMPTKTLTVVPGSPVTFNTGSIQIYASGASIGANRITYYKTPTEVRLYRTDATGTFRLVTTNADGSDTDIIDYATLETADPVYVDTKLDSDLGEPLSTAGWSVPPSGLKGIINAPNGIVAAYKGRTIAGAVPYAPYAWPIANQVATDYEVVGLVPTSAGIVVVTKGMPAILIGDNPANWSMQKLEYPQGCVARRSIVDMGEFAMYASPDGLVAIAGANVEILTKPIMTREQWQPYIGYDENGVSTLIAAQVEGRYIATYLDGSARKGFIYDPQTQSFTDLNLEARAFTNDLLNDVLLMLDADGSIKKWNQDTSTWKPYTWISKWFQLPIPELMGVAQIFTTTVDLTGRDLTFVLRGYDNNQSVKIYEISTDTSPDAILGNRPFRIPYVAPGRFTAFRVELVGSIPVGTVMVSRTVDELKLAP